MSGKIEISREMALFESIIGKDPEAFLREPVYQVTESEILKFAKQIASPVVERQPAGQWRIPVNGDWFYGTKEQCERERAEYETTFTAEDYAEAGVVLPEQIWSSPPAPVAVVLSRYTCIGKGGDYELLGSAIGAGTLKDMSAIPVYRDTATGQLFVRTPLDFATRMECLDKVKELNQ